MVKRYVVSAYLQSRDRRFLIELSEGPEIVLTRVSVRKNPVIYWIEK